MKNVSAALMNYINNARGNGDCQLAFADCVSFTLMSGATLYLTNWDLPILYNGVLFRADGPLINGLRYHASTGLSVDSQQLTIAARPNDLMSGAPILAALRSGAFDGASIQRDRVFMNGPGQAPIGGATLFKGRLSTIDYVGRTQAKITVASDLALLDLSMPRNLYGPTCQHALYDTGCGLNAQGFATKGAVGAGSSNRSINWPQVVSGHKQGTLLMTSGSNANIRATIASVNNGVGLTLIAPLPNQLNVGDSFIAFFGCDHTQATCQSLFNNLARFRGFPFVPPPSMAQ